MYLCVCNRNGMKVLLGAGAMYVTVNEGVWSTSESGLYAGQRLRTYVLPETTQYWDKVLCIFRISATDICRNCKMAFCS